MRDFASPRYQRKRGTANRAKKQRKPLNLKKYLRPLGMVFLCLSGIALVCGALFMGYRSLASLTFFRLKEIKVSPTKRLTRQEVMAIADVEPGKDLLRLDLKRMGEQLAQNPWVETVRIRRFYPDGLSIAISEREPLAVVNMGYLYYLDRTGTVFKTLSQGDRLDYPVVTGFSEEDLNSDPSGMKEALKSTCELLALLRVKCASILADVSEIHYDKGYGFTLFTASGGLPIKVGADDFAAKLGRLSRIYQSLMEQRQTIQYIDLDYNDKIIVKKI
jgi:cell division septal protein FtsQ